MVVRDNVERHQFKLQTPSPVTPNPTDESQFSLPTDAAVRIKTNRIEVAANTVVCVRDESDSMLAQVDQQGSERLGDETYSIELFGAVKTYLKVDGPLTIDAKPLETVLSFEGPTEVHVGARSSHESPATTVTTTENPYEVMQAVSAFSSALKTTSVERSYPTLRGHPPLLELGDELDIPEGLHTPETGIRIELPPTLSHIFVATPLAYYLGAKLVPGNSPRLVTDTGFVHEFDGPHGFEEEVSRALKRTFFLDCVVRTEGIYDVELHERRTVESRIDIDASGLYDAPLSEQLETYFDVPYECISDLIPEWKLTTHVAPESNNIELLPFVTNDLAVVRTPSGTEIPESEVQAAVVDDFLRDETVRSTGTTTTDETYVRPSSTDSVEQAWVGDGTPVGASKATPAAYRNRLQREPATGDIGITVVCNDQEMLDESNIVDDVYGSRDSLSFDVDAHYNLSRAELREILAKSTDFLHYIGHIDDEGFQCRDGKVDAKTLDHVGTGAFFLNACQSYSQGLALIEAGAIGGIVTLSDVINSQAVGVGCTIARFLNRGFPLQASLNLVQIDNDVRHQYAVVGDGTISVVQAESGFAVLCEVSYSEDNIYDLSYKTYLTSRCGPGSLTIPAFPGNQQYYLGSQRISNIKMTEDELRDFLSLEQIPVIYNSEVYWDDGFLS
ncbi:hypothetical protein E6P09_09395 [Haloferax mediterranei ATCC 33500]|uniref:Caspase family protein n=1 Tax=Haloferax mediterranei (strain ATCC 33500 / DSM 1411 / JCM 8866 / NBRC 14739 / NCIMB 2177 / R-4) TaxID=523841 RepID=A0A4P8P6L1_HALMT|nr:hypothetical protein [Haloferax mediterranei]MDX5989082.1 hypothetical protein [Haloferax mediterranei ATCC 33500]QCQ76632.1 hypothetical protein E6P09_09395 [Haloferax mediterranei ATCC 33500]